jgi:hypothetical protein
MLAILGPKSVWILVFCVWGFLLLIYAWFLQDHEAGNDITSIQQQRFEKIQFLAIYFPVIALVARVADIVIKFVRDKD